VRRRREEAKRKIGREIKVGKDRKKQWDKCRLIGYKEDVKRGGKNRSRERKKDERENRKKIVKIKCMKKRKLLKKE
jgi:hypothetical protein